MSSTEKDPLASALQAVRYYDQHEGRKMSDICKEVYRQRVRGFEDHPEVAEFIDKYDLMAS